MLRLRTTKGPDNDLQALLRTTIGSLQQETRFFYTTDWIKSHQDKNADIASVPRPVALNVRMDANTKIAYDFEPEWLTQVFVPVFKEEGCAVYFENQKITSSLQTTLLDNWHADEARAYLLKRHGITADLFQHIHWQALKHALKKFSAHRRATIIKAIHRHLPTQEKLYMQGRVTMTSICPRCLTASETNAHVFCCKNEAAIKQRKEDWQELEKQLIKNRTSVIILRSWKEHLLPRLGLALPSDITAVVNIVLDDDTAYLLQWAIRDQTEIGWDKLLLGFSSTIWSRIQANIDSYNPKAPQRSPTDWIKSSIHQFLKLSLRCWKARNVAVHGETRKEQNMIALANAREKITAIYLNPPSLAPQFRSIQEIPLAHRLKLPLHAAEQWLSLIAHQLKVTKHNAKALLRQHIPIQAHFRNMQRIARGQRFEKRQYRHSPNRAHRREVQAAIIEMRKKLYASKKILPKVTLRRKRSPIQQPRVEILNMTPSTHPSPRLHPP